MEKEKQLLSWVDKQIASIYEKFSDKKDTAISFHEFDNMDMNTPYFIPEPMDGNKGGVLTIVKNTTTVKVIHYSMYKGAVLDIHHHPDFLEVFNIESGLMTNEVSNITYGPGSKFEMLPYEPHQFRCDEDAKMIITLMKVK